MEIEKQNDLETFMTNEILRLNFKRIIINKACQKFDISKEDATNYFVEVRFKMKKAASNRAWTYLLLGSIFFGVGLFGTLSKTGFIFYGAILGGTGMLVTSAGLFRISLIKSK